MASLDPGKRLGPYEIIAAIGAGGMGEVYRARDSRIGREVAIKILPAEYSENQDRLARFEHEARAAGMLNHPNILAVYDVGNENSCSYLVTELLEGETLRHKLEQGALPTRKALEYATQLAGGLAAAHQKGIVHRDLKPENIFVTRDGRLKILDFGLAKLIQPELLPANDISNMATGWPQSLPGMILGTIGYMSPEQVRGQNADSRSDLFTFGEILYEMLTGNRAFHGQTPADTMSAILHKDVPALPQQPDLLAPERILRRCLEKDPAQRFQSAQDLAFALEALSGSSGSQTQLQGTAFTAPSKTRLYPWIIAALLFLAAIAAWGSRLLEKKAQAPLIQLELMGPKDHILNGIPVISPDGSAVALTATNKNGDSTLWVRSFDSSNLREMPGTEGATTPFWSADNRSIGFFAQGKLKKIQISGGPAQDLSEAPDPRGGTWNQQDVIVFAPYPGDGLYKINAGGGSAVRITSLDKSSVESSHRFPSFLPDGIHYLYFGWGPRGKQKAGVYLGSLNSKERIFLFPSDHAATFAPPGYLIFNQTDTLLAQPFDPKKLQLSGSPFPVLQQIWFPNSWAGALAVSVSNNSILTAIRGTLLNDLRCLDRNGNPTGSQRTPADYADAGSFSPDGKRIALGINVPIGTNNISIWMTDPANSNTSRFSFDPSSNWNPIWSPDGERIVFASNRSGPLNLYLKNSSGAGNEELFLKSDDWLVPDDWTANPETIVYEEIDPSTKFDLWVLPLSGDRKPFPFLKTPANEAHAKISNDGNWIAYCSDESGQPEVYVQPYLKKQGGRWQVSVNGGTTPKWRRDGKELFYLTTDGKVMSVEIKAASTFEFSPPKMLFQTRIVGVPGASSLLQEYDPSPDGQQFLVRAPLPNSEFRPISVIFNWPALFEKKN